MLTIHPLHTLFEFIPEFEKEAMEKAKNEGTTYEQPLTFLFTQMDGELFKYYSREIGKSTKQQQVVDSKEDKIYNTVDIDSERLRALHKEIAKKIVKKVTGFNFEELNVTYPVTKDGKLVEFWCSSEEAITKFIERCPSSVIAELVNTATDVSSLKPYEKKS